MRFNTLLLVLIGLILAHIKDNIERQRETRPGPRPWQHPTQGMQPPQRRVAKRSAAVATSPPTGSSNNRNIAVSSSARSARLVGSITAPRPVYWQGRLLLHRPDHLPCSGAGTAAKIRSLPSSSTPSPEQRPHPPQPPSHPNRQRCLESERFLCSRWTPSSQTRCRHQYHHGRYLGAAAKWTGRTFCGGGHALV